MIALPFDLSIVVTLVTKLLVAPSLLALLEYMVILASLVTLLLVTLLVVAPSSFASLLPYLPLSH